MLRICVGAALLSYAAALAFVLFTPAGSVPSGLVQDAMTIGARMDVPAKFLERDRVEFGLNVLAFAPLSFLGSLLRPSAAVSTWTAAAFAASLIVEGIQTTMPERMAAHSDVVANTAGAAAGALIAWMLLRPFVDHSEGRADLSDRHSPAEQDQLPG